MGQGIMAGYRHMHAPVPLLAIACPSGAHELAQQDQTAAPQTGTTAGEDCNILDVEVSSLQPPTP